MKEEQKKPATPVMSHDEPLVSQPSGLEKKLTLAKSSTGSAIGPQALVQGQGNERLIRIGKGSLH